MATANETTSPKQVVFDVNSNKRGITEISVKGNHVSVEDLKNLLLEDSTIWRKMYSLGRRGTDKLMSKNHEKKPKLLEYLDKDIPAYPTPVEFHISEVSHVTDTTPFQQILGMEGFKSPTSNVVWWSLNIKEEDIKSAEKRYLQEIFPNQSQEHDENSEPFLHNFTNSPAFQSESRYGNHRFTFPLTELMNLYQEQHCGGEEPVLRVMNTMFYKQEILYGVLIHSPHDSKRIQREFGKLPLLEDSQFVQYQKNSGEMIWRAQAVSDDLGFNLLVNPEEARVEVEQTYYRRWYVWDHACLAFYLPKTLRVPRRRLIEATETCKLQKFNLIQSRIMTDQEKKKNREARFEKAKKVVEDLKQELEDEAENVNASRN